MVELACIIYFLIGYGFIFKITDFDGLKVCYEDSMTDYYDLMLIFSFTILFWPFILFIWWKFGSKT